MLTPNSYNHPAVTSSCLRQTSSTNNGYVKNKLTTSTILLSPHLVSDTSLPQATVMLTSNEQNRPALTSSHMSSTSNRDVKTNEQNRPALTSSRLRHISSTGNHTCLPQATVMLKLTNKTAPLSPHLVSDTYLPQATVRHMSSTSNRDVKTNEQNRPALTSSRLRHISSTGNHTCLPQATVMLKLTNKTAPLSPHLVSDTSLPQPTVRHMSSTSNRDVKTNEQNRPALTSSRKHLTTTTTLLSPHLISDISLPQPTVMLTSNNYYNYYCPTDISSCLRHVSSTANRELNTKQLQLPRSHLTSSEKHLF
ncbi:hypothetical protein J6590_081982 [Homalodisca vitripennis]|nr:hypothetical protein J6590_081982 [Homalodisca vitripennis]